jgi:hypothetical protein
MERNNSEDMIDDDVVKRPKKRKDAVDKDAFYVNPALFKSELEKYYKSDIMTEGLALNIKKIAQGLSYNWRFIEYTNDWREEMVGDAVIKMYAALTGKKFRIDSTYNPFSYFNAIAWNAFTNRIKKENRQHKGLEEYKQMMYEQSMAESDGFVYTKPTSIDDEDFENGY